MPLLDTLTESPADRVRVRRATQLQGGSDFATDVRRGLLATPKFLLPRYFYDDLGSKLFEAITVLPEYYVSRAEEEILSRHAGDIVAHAGRPVRVLELGSGSGTKTRLLLRRLLEKSADLEFLPIDISESALREAGLRLTAEFPDLRVHALLGEYRAALAAVEPVEAQAGKTLALFLGSSLGNLDPGERTTLLQALRRALQPEDSFLLGVDLKKDERVLVPAYADALGVTAAFNLNLLSRINRELGGGFDLASFRHLALYNREEGRIEMHLESLRAQTVPIRRLDIEVPFAAGETVFTESSYKFDLEQVAALAAASGFRVTQSWTDGERRFASVLLVAV